MSKKYILGVLAIGSFCFAPFALAQVVIPNPLAGGGVNTFGDLLLKIANGVGMVIASLGTIMIVVAGILYLLSAGDPGKMQKAKTALIYAIIGIAIGIMASSIVSMVRGIIGA